MVSSLSKVIRSQKLAILKHVVICSLLKVRMILSLLNQTLVVRTIIILNTLSIGVFDTCNWNNSLLNEWAILVNNRSILGEILNRIIGRKYRIIRYLDDYTYA